MKNDGSFSLSRTERIVVAACLLGLLLCSILLTSDQTFEFLFARHAAKRKYPVAGEIVFSKGDIRQRFFESHSWEKVKEKSIVRFGDSVFTGSQSQAHIVLKNGSVMNLDQNSLIRIPASDSEALPELVFGNFLIKVNGSMKFTLMGESIELIGDNPEIQIIAGNGLRPVVRLVKGMAQIRTDLESRTIALNEITEIPGLTREPRVLLEALKYAALPRPILEPVIHVDELYDFYELVDGTLFPRTERRPVLKTAATVAWSKQGKPKKIFAQLSSSPSFETITETFAAPGEESSGVFNTVNLGINYYRLSIDQKTWSEPEPFEVRARPLDSPPPRIQVSESRVYLRNEAVEVSAEIQSEFDNFVLEVSDAQNFPVSKTRVYMLTKRQIQLFAYEPKSLFIRVRGVNPDLKLTAHSKPVRIDVVRPIEKPLLLSRPLLTPKPRQPSAVSTLKYSIATDPLIDYLNREYPSSKLSLEGATFTMFSRDQLDHGAPNPVALMLGLRWHHWSGKHGLETSFKTRVVNAETSPESEASPYQLEARYHYRWLLPFNPFSPMNRSQFSLLGGYEVYRNPARGYFSPGYDLFKAGFSLALPLFSRLDTGGEILYGHGPESSRKYELSGYIHYYIQRKWSFGFGYRVHLFEAGSESVTPFGLPYREGFGEGYSVLRWHY